MGELKVLTPLSDEETRKLLPAELAGRKRGEVRMGDLLGKKAQAALQRGEGRAALVQLTTKIESGRLRSASPPC